MHVGDPHRLAGGVGAITFSVRGIPLRQNLAECQDDRAPVERVEPEMAVDRCVPIGAPAVPVSVIVVVLAPHAPFARRQRLHTGELRHVDHGRSLRERLERLFEEGLERLADPNHDVGILQLAGFGGLELEGVRRRTGRHQKMRAADALHHGRR